jgi:hypothetical protein
MDRLRRVGGATIVVIALLIVLFGWLQKQPHLTKDDARGFTSHALRSGGLQNVTVAKDVKAGTYALRGARSPLPVWDTSATVRGGKISLKVDRRVGQAVFVDDRADGGGQLLSDAQFNALGRVSTDPARSRRLERNAVGTLAGVALACVAVLATTIVPRRLEEQHDAR